MTVRKDLFVIGGLVLITIAGSLGCYVLVDELTATDPDDSLATVESSEPTMCHFRVRIDDPDRSVRLRSPHDASLPVDGIAPINSPPGGWVTAELFIEGRTLWNRSVQHDCTLQPEAAQGGDPER